MMRKCCDSVNRSHTVYVLNITRFTSVNTSPYTKPKILTTIKLSLHVNDPHDG